MSKKSLSDLLTQCIHCGFCLEDCPTYQETGNEAESPRGRIYLIRLAEEGQIPYDQDARQHLDGCLGCRACETACPSGVQYGKILEMGREQFEKRDPRKLPKLMTDALSKPAVASVQFALGHLLPDRKMPETLSRLISGQKAEAQVPTLPDPAPWPEIDESRLPPVKGEVAMLRGCVMRVMYPDVHDATERLLRRVGYRVVPVKAGCCGALHAHAGYLEDAKKLAERLTKDLPSDLPIIVNAAGCGSTMKEYDGLFGEEFKSFSDRVFDASEFLLHQGLDEALNESSGLSKTVTYHDACHLAHGQNIRQQPRTLLKAVPNLNLVPLAQSETCCGSAGTYNVTQPQMARRLVERKYRNIAATGAEIVVSGNPGCHAWIAQAAKEHGGAIRVMHTLDLLEASFSGLRAES